MSFQNQGRKVQPEKRKNFPEHLEEIYNSESLEFAATIAQTLHLDFGETGKSIKTVMKYTGAGERTVKNWFQGKNGPNGENLIKLMRHSDKILEVSLFMAGRDNLVATKSLLEARDKLSEMIDIIDYINHKNPSSES